ncbi:S-layer homology domain-containing protein [Congzhengia sp.]|uniref:S-layer homology domain-containing protein n=1 Tax=Congzhengia sp. TaxID=2944168 RepID=UPI0030784DB1
MKKLSVTFITVFMFQLLLYPLTAFAQTLVANDFTKSTPRDTTLSFSANDFIGSANPPSGKSLVSIRFDQVTNPTAGNLKLNGSVVGKGNTVSVGDLNGLTFVPTTGYEGEAIFTWTANYGGAQSPYPGAVVITIGSGVETPSVIPEGEQTEEGETPQEPQTPAVPEKGETQQPQQENYAEKENYDGKSENNAQQNAEVKQEETKEAAPSQNNELKPLRYEDMLSHWGAYSAGMLASRGYVIGEDFGNNFYFNPDEKINRFEFVLMVNAIFGVKPKDSLADNPFSDKNVPSYVMRVGIAAYEYDIIAGTKGKDGLLYFNPYDSITRAEAITIVDYALRLDSYGVDEAEFKDVTNIPDWAMQSVKNLEAYGIIQGYEDNTIRPYTSITRAQAAEMIWQALKFLDVKRTSNAVFTTVIYGD